MQQQQDVPLLGQQAGRARRSEAWVRLKKHRWHLLFIAPMLILFVSFTLYPSVLSWYYGFFEWDGFGPPTEFVGFENFVETATSPLFWNAFRNSFWFAFGGIFIEMPLALIFAVMLNNATLRGRSIYRVLLFLPVVTTTAVVGIVFAILLDPAGGAINEALLRTGLVNRPVNFLGSEALALPTIVGLTVWKGLGVTLIYWLAALQTVPTELYEAAQIDGANVMQRFLHITVPLLVPIGLVILLLTFKTSLGPFDLVQTMTAGGPNRATDVVPTYIFRYAFNPEGGFPRYGFASAAALFFGVAVLLITLILGGVIRRMRSELRGGGNP